MPSRAPRSLRATNARRSLRAPSWRVSSAPARARRLAGRVLGVPAVLVALLIGMVAGSIGTAPSLGIHPITHSAPAAYDFGQGLLEMTSKGGVYAFGAETFHGSASGQSTIVGGARMTTNAGYWLVGANGGVFAYGAAQFYGSMGGQYLPAPIVGMAATGDNGGYWLVGADGSVYAFGDAGYFGSEANQTLAGPVVGIAPSGDSGYWLVASTGGVFAFGSAQFHGSEAGKGLSAPIVGMAALRNGSGYWLVGQDGGVFAFGSAPFETSVPSTKLPLPIVGIQATTTGGGYWLVGADGSIVAYGTAQYFGSETQTGINVTVLGWVVGLATTPATGTPDSTPGSGYWLTTADGDVYGFSADVYGQRPGVSTIVSIASSATGKGYQLAGANGGIYAYGTAPFYGSYLSFGDHISDLVGLARVVAPSGQADYCGAERNGWVHCFGSPEPTGSAGCAGTDGALYGCAVGDSPPPIVAIVATADGRGYWEVSDNGEVYAFGDAQFRSNLSTKGVHVSNVVGMATVGPSGTTGYWMTGTTGGVYTFGFATFHGSFQSTGIGSNGPVVGIAAPDANNGYWLASSTGGVFALRKGTFPFYGSMGGTSLPSSVTAIAAVA